MPNQNPLLPAIAPANSGALTTTTGPQRIATRMAENLLGVARSQERALAAQRRYRIGDYEFREADHAQIQRWARRLGMEPEKVVEVLASSQKNRSREIDADFQVTDGAIVSLVWDFDLLPLTDWAWVRGVRTARLGILNAPSGFLPPLPEYLHELICYDNNLTSINLTQVPKLKKLWCWNNKLSDIDLNYVPQLQKLYCWTNQISHIDLSGVPELTELGCANNQLTDLDLNPVSKLKKLNCYSNQLTYIELASVSGMESLWCGKNPLTQLDLRPVPKLQSLSCTNTPVTCLDLIPVSGLIELDCSHSPLTVLNLTPVPRLQSICCDRNLTITGAPKNLKVRRV